MSKRKFERKESKDSKESITKSKHQRGRRNRFNGDTKRVNDRDTRDSNMVDTQVKPANDVTWYTKSMEQVMNSANISFMNALGAPLQVWDKQSGVLTGDESAPGVMRIGYIPTFGNPVQRDDPINVAMNKTYAWIRYYNSGSKNYDAPDYMKYLAVMDSAFAFAGFLIRIYGLANSYSSVNRFWPESFFTAMGVNFDSIKTNLAPFRTYVNNYISKVNSLAVPTSLPIFARHFWMCSNVYKDADSLWSQCYIHVPEVYCKYNNITSDVDFYSLYDGKSPLMTYADLLSKGNDIIGSIMESQDFYIMSGDTIKAFGDNVFRINGIASDFILYPVYDAGVLNQIMSSFAMGDVVTETASTIVVPSTNGYAYSLYEDPVTGTIKLGYNDNGTYLNTTIEFAVPDTSQIDATSINQLTAKNDKLINLTVNEVNPLHVIESTRALAIPRNNARKVNNVFGTGNDGLVWGLRYSGADVYTTFQIISKALVSGDVVPFITEKFASFNYADGGNAISTRLFSRFIRVASFDWHPILYTITKSSTLIYAHQPYVDIYRAAVVTDDVISRIHEVANLSLFDVTLQNSIKLG